MDLMGGYLLVVLILFMANLSLLMGNIKINNFRLAAISLTVLIVSFVLMNVSGYLADALSFLNNYFSYFFIAVSILAFLLFLHYFRRNSLRHSIALTIILYIISVVCLASQAKLSIFDDLSYSLLGCLTLFLVYQITKLLVHAKRQYPVIIGEYVSLFSMLLFIFGLTYDSTRYLDYTAFTPFLILTPTYQLIYVVIGLVVVIIVGLLYNEHKGGSA
jgi:hypothetical protein